MLIGIKGKHEPLAVEDRERAGVELKRLAPRKANGIKQLEI